MSDAKQRLTRRAGVIKETLPELPERGEVFIRVLSTDEILALSDLTDVKQAARQLIADAVVEEDGTKMFTPAEAGDLDWIVAKQLSRLARKINGLKLTDEQLEDAKKNS